MEHEHLHLLINEEIYILPQTETNKSGEVEPIPKTNTEANDSQQTSENQVQNLVEEKQAVSESNKEIPQESPKIPAQQEDTLEIPFAIFHNSSIASDIELLNKIIAACKLPEDQHKIFDGGFDQTIKFRKALVFVPEAKAFYTPIPYKDSEFLCSKPLDQISGDVQEKAKLWTALQKFILP